MKIISFTKKGSKLNISISEKLKGKGFSIGEYEGLTVIGLDEFSKKGFEEKEPMIFIGAVGIAVRAIAKYVEDKFLDPPVVVIDENGNYVIPILSGHVGGGNKLANRVSEILGAQSVITTATDINGVISIDTFAVENNLSIVERDLAKEVSKYLLEGKKVGFFLGNQEVEEYGFSKTDELGVFVGAIKEMPYKHTLHLVPKALCVGVGCRRNTTKEQIFDAIDTVFTKNNLFKDAIYYLGTIDIKKDETGLLEYCKSENLRLKFFSADELLKQEGITSASDFVKEITGTDNVCERSAMALGGSKIIISKTIINGVTVAIAEKNWGVKFE